MSRLLILSIAITCLYSCHSAKKITTAAPVVVTKDTVVTVLVPTLPATDKARNDSLAFMKDTYKKILGNHIGFTTFSGKIDLDYQDAEGKEYNVNAHLRMYKDSVIWISITAILGFEGLRVCITPDSIKLLDKQNKIYTPKSISFLQELTALPLDLSTLQELLIGNPVFLDSNIISYNQTANIISILSRGSFFQNLVTVDAANKLVQTSKLNDLDQQRERSCYLTYTDYENKKGMNFSQKRTILVVDKKKLSIKMDYKQYDFNEKLSFPFSVPKNYTVN